MSQQTINRPIWSKNARGGLSVAVWSRSDAEGGNHGSSQFSITYKKRYKDKNGQWQDSSVLFPEDLPKLALLFEQAFDFTTFYENDRQGGYE